MTDPEIEVADRILTRNGIEYVVVGGQAIGKSVTTTGDVDVMVTTTDYTRAVALLSKDPELSFRGEEEGVAHFTISSFGGIPFDVLDSQPFSGEKPLADFFAFLVTRESITRESIRYASPEAVWYTRLMVKRWRVYSEKVINNIAGGIAAGRLRRVEEIARQFGTDELLRERIRYVRAELQRPDLRYILGEE